MRLRVQENVSLKQKHTFGLAAIADAYVQVSNIEQLREALALPFKSKIILGGGSNLIFTKDYAGLVIRIDIKNIEVVRELKNKVHLRVGAGENWHNAVLWTLNNNFGGLENLSLIPGTVGASPIQNIGAYGVELKDVFLKLKALEIATGKVKIFNKKACKFGYRDSYFKQIGKGKYIILEVFFTLTHTHHQTNISYGAIQAELDKMSLVNNTIQNISKAVIKIRNSKLPDPQKVGNAGSFFKNPIISKTRFQKIQNQFPDVVNYALPNGKIKLAAGWLIDQCQLKGTSIGDIGVHPNQALVLVNYGSGTARDLEAMITKVIQSVENKFKVVLELEVNLV